MRQGGNRTMTMRGILGGALLAVTVLGTTAGCGDQSGDPVGFAPEGDVDQAFLITSVQPVSHDSSQVILIATVIAPPPADGVRLYLNPGNLGYRPASDGVFGPVTTLTSGWSVYQNVVDGFDPTVPSEIIARGARGGVESAAGPVSNRSSVPAGSTIGLARLGDVALTSPGDSTFAPAQPTFTWQASTLGSRYILQVYRLDGVPVYSALVNGTSHQMGVGPGTIFQYIPLLNSGLYRWDVQVLDGGNKVAAISRETRQFFAAVPLP